MPEVDPKRKKKLQEVLDRMEKGFDENMLDPLLETIYNEPEDKPLPSEGKVRYKKKKFQVIKVDNTSGDTLAGLLGSKIGESFSMAAGARRASADSKGRGFFLKKALQFQFGGDLINRTRGTFSKDPTDTQDPALGKSGRFSAEVAPYLDPVQGPAPPPAKASDFDAAADEVIDKLDELGDTKDKKDEQLSLAIEINQDVNKGVAESVKENNTLLKKSLDIKNRFLRFQSDAEDEKKSQRVEKRGEFAVDRSSLTPVDNSKLFFPDPEEEPQQNGFMNFLDFGLDLLDGGNYFGKGASVGRRGMGRVVQRTALRLGGKKAAKSAIVQGGQALLKRVALPVLRPIFKRIPIVGGLIDFVVSLALGEPVGRAAAKAIGATLGGALGTLIPIPGVGTIAGGIVGDLVGGAIYDAVTGGAPKDPTNSTPEVKEAAGAPTSFADQSGGLGSPDPVPEKLASGGILAGEAGPEAVFNLNSVVGRSTVKAVSSVSSSISAIPFILGITDDIINSTPGMDPLKPFLNQYMAPLVRLFGMSNFNTRSLLGNSAEKVQSEASKGDELIRQAKAGQETSVQAQETMTGGPVKGVNMGGGEGKTSAAAVYNYLKSKGLSDIHAKGITVNIMRESGFKLGAHNPNDPGAGSFGLFQWNAGRADKMMAAVPDWQTNWQGQIDYALGEDHGPTYLSTQFTTAGDAAYDWMKYWERPAESIQAQYTPQVYQGQINAMGLHEGMPEPQGQPRGTPDVPPADSDANGGHDTDNPGGNLLFSPPVSKEEMNSVGPGPQGSRASIVANMPSSLASAANNGYVTVQPIIVKVGSGNQVVGYRKNIDTGEDGGVARFYYNTQGGRTSLEQLKEARLQLN